MVFFVVCAGGHTSPFVGLATATGISRHMAARCGAAAELSSAINTASTKPREKTFTSLDYIGT